MSLARDLGYRFRPPNAVQRAMQVAVASRPGAWVLARTLPPVDTWVGRLSGGRTSVPEAGAGLPVLDVTTTGRRTGQRRTTHLVAVPFADTLALIGSNFGQPATPAWALNLEADPRATVTYRNRTIEVVARPATDDEAEQVMAAAAPLYLGYAAYRRRIGERRRLRVFLLEPA
ncbi:nitroreductase family deazaflavin-dependent oxidoreductase [Geodermatophilus amargosae]|uniref:nitroreductase family deazaflavin-dependent oxidoreductase n=1 Tax=Geodermatophilus amargosae TaxID=1296565 RepID=UPI0034DE6B4E